MKSEQERVWHAMEEAAVVGALGADVSEGLSEEEAALRLERHGRNELTARKGPSALLRFMSQFHAPLVYILLGAAAVTLLLQEWVDSGVILGVVLVNAVVGFLQERKAIEAIAALARTMQGEATTLRGGARRRIPASLLVPGDVVIVQSGDRVPADLRLLRCRDAQIDESALTGESVPVHKKVGAMQAGAALADRVNMAYSSALVTYGQAVGVVVATGDRTEVGRISELIATAEQLATPLTRKIAQFSRVLLVVILVVAALSAGVGLLHGQSLHAVFLSSVALAVAAIPEGLPAAITIMLAIGVSRMARRRAIIRKLPAVETLGGATVICSDKTGTLTQNQMTVQAVWAGGRRYSVQGSGYAPEGDITHDGGRIDAGAHPALRECLRAGALCNDSSHVRVDGRWTIEGDPTEGALLVAAAKAGMTPDQLERERPRLDSVPFESERQFMATLHGAAPGGAGALYVKGSVERLLAMCECVMDANGERGELDRDAAHREADELARSGLRVLAMAMKDADVSGSGIESPDAIGGLTFLGLQGMIDPPRAEAIEAVAMCRTAGVRVKMITGDHAGTASAIAAQLGMHRQGDPDAPPRAVTGRELDEVSDEELPELVERVDVFARTAPEQKLRLVRALQRRGHVVAMTGDGVNDAPALRQADIGVAMGITGTEVAKEAADMVLTDDNFASIEAAVEEGRGVYDNLTKFIVWTLPTNVGEGMVILTAVLVGATLPLLPVQVLWLNMTTALTLGLMLAFEPKEPGIMERPPRDPAAPILTRALVVRILLVSTLLLLGAFGLFQWELVRGAPQERARTVAVSVFVFGEMCYLFNCRSLTRSMFALGLLTNRWLLAGVAAMTGMQLLYVYNPVMQRLFQSAAIGWGEWARILLASLAIYAVVGVEKWVRRRMDAHAV